MTWAAPWILTLLVPWVGVVIVVLLGQRPREWVPFVKLWEGVETQHRRKWGWMRPPMWVVMGLLAILLGIVGAAGPGIQALENKKQCVLIDRVSARNDPRPQIMVSARGEGEIRIDAGTERIEKTISGGDLFVDVKELNGATVTAGEERWRIERRGAWPMVTVREGVSEAVSRVVAVYRENRKGTGGEVVVGHRSESANDQPAVIVGSGALKDSPGEVRWADHPMTRGVDWSGVRGIYGFNLGKDWTPMVWKGNDIAVAVRETPRGVWVGLGEADWSATPGFVIFWTKVLDWVGEGGERIDVVKETQPKVENASKPIGKWFILGGLLAAGVGALTIKKDEPSA